MASHVFAHQASPGRLYHREVRLDADGGLTLVGHDVGPDAMGGEEYEWERRVSPDGVARLMTALGATGDPLATVAAAFTSTFALEQRLEGEGIESDFWSRVG